MEASNESKTSVYNDKGIAVSVIIISFNCPDFLRNCLESIKKYNDIGEQLEVIVVDNSTDSDIFNWIESEHPEGFLYIKNENKGFGQANNVGAKIARGSVLAFLNPDTELTEPLFGYTVNKFEKNNKLGMTGYKLINKSGTYTPSMAMRFHLGVIRGFINTLLTRLDFFVPSLMCTSGADLFVRKEAFMKAGMFDENLFMYCEEPDLTNRINAQGYINTYDKKIKIYHHEAGSSEGMVKRYGQRMKAYKYYCQKYGIAFEKYLKEEMRYCMLKEKLFLSLGNKEKSDAYKMIVNNLKAYKGQ